MKNGKHAVHSAKSFKSGKRSLSFIVALVLLVTLAIGGTIAYLTQTTSEVTNTFTSAGAPTPEITEDFDGDVKENVQVKLDTNGSGSYYVRAAIVFSFQDDDGNTVAKVPTAADYTITLGEDWQVGPGGYYYYKEPITPGTYTTNLINTCTSNSSEYHLVVDIVAQTIQAVPAEAAANEWGYAPNAA